MRRSEPALSPVVVDHRDAPAGREVAPQVAEVGRAVLEVVVGVDDEHEIDAAVGKGRIFEAAEDHLHVGQVFLRHALPKVFVHLLVDVDRVDLPVGPGCRRETKREIAASRAEVGDAIPRTDAERGDHPLRLLPFVPRSP